MSKKNKTPKAPANKKRGMGLSLLLGLMILMNLLTMGLIWSQIKGPDAMLFPYLVSLLFIATIAKLVAVVGIWFWERWALYVYAGSVVATIVIGLMMTGTWLFAFNEILPLAILGWLLKDRYHYFE